MQSGQAYKEGDDVEYFDQDAGVQQWVPAHIFAVEMKPMSERSVFYLLSGSTCLVDCIWDCNCLRAYWLISNPQKVPYYCLELGDSIIVEEGYSFHLLCHLMPNFQFVYAIESICLSWRDLSPLNWDGWMRWLNWIFRACAFLKLPHHIPNSPKWFPVSSNLLRWPITETVEAAAPVAETEYDDDYWYTYAEGNQIEYYHQEYGWVAATITGVDTGSFSDRYFAIKPARLFYRPFLFLTDTFLLLLRKSQWSSRSTVLSLTNCQRWSHLQKW